MGCVCCCGGGVICKSWEMISVAFNKGLPDNTEIRLGPRLLNEV